MRATALRVLTTKPRGGARPLLGVGAWTTPRLLRSLLLVSWFAAGLVVSTTFIAQRQLSGAVHTVGRDAAPSILAAQKIRLRFADMDANAAMDFLGGPGGFAPARDAFEQDRQRAGSRLLDAAQNITYGDEERVPIQTMEDQFGVYLQLIAQARLLHSQDLTSMAALDLLRQAAGLMHTVLLPAAQALDDANQRHLDQTYNDNQRIGTWISTFVYLISGLLIAILIGTQIFLAWRMRRTINPALIVASIVLIVLLIDLSRTFGAAAYDLKVAKPDAFDSLGPLSRARAIAYDARGNESLSLLDPAHRAEYERAFRDDIAQLVDVPITDQLIATTDAQVQEITSTRQGVVSAQHDAVQFHGYFAVELNNITFVGEKQAALSMLRTAQAFLSADDQVRTLEQTGHHAEAVALWIGSGDGQAGGTFSHFDSAIGQTLGINQAEFDGAVQQGFADLRTLDALALVASLGIGLLTWLGIRPRLREYDV